MNLPRKERGRLLIRLEPVQFCPQAHHLADDHPGRGRDAALEYPTGQRREDAKKSAGEGARMGQGVPRRLLAHVMHRGIRSRPVPVPAWMGREEARFKAINGKVWEKCRN